MRRGSAILQRAGSRGGDRRLVLSAEARPHAEARRADPVARIRAAPRRMDGRHPAPPDGAGPVAGQRAAPGCSRTRRWRLLLFAPRDVCPRRRRWHDDTWARAPPPVASDPRRRPRRAAQPGRAARDVGGRDGGSTEGGAAAHRPFPGARSPQRLGLEGAELRRSGDASSEHGELHVDRSGHATERHLHVILDNQGGRR